MTSPLPHPPTHAAPSAWTPTRTARQVAAALQGARRVAIATHAKPDGDAAGSTLALARALRQTGIDAHCWYVAPMPRWFEPIAGDTPAHVFEAPSQGRKGATPDAHPEPDAIVVADTGSWAQLDDLAPWVRARPERSIIIDHHLSGDADMSAARLLVPDAAAAAEIVADVCVLLTGAPSAAALPLEIAEPLYLGLATDTGWFRYSNTSPRTLRLAADLREAGVDAPRLFQLVEQQDRPARLRLLARALSSLELLAGDRVGLMRLSRADFEFAHGDTDDTTGFASDILSVAAIQVGVLLTESPPKPGKPPLTKASLRSKPGPHAVDVAALTKALGGGGHARAAGVKLALPIDQARDALVNAILAAMPPAPSTPRGAAQ